MYDFIMNLEFALNMSNCLDYSAVKSEDQKIVTTVLMNLFGEREIQGFITPLNGGKSLNHLYLAKVNDDKVVLRISKNTALPIFQKMCEYTQLVSSLNLGPKVLYQNHDEKVLVTQFVEGESLKPAHLDDPGNLKLLAHSLQQLHESQVASQISIDIFKLTQEKLDNLLIENSTFKDTIYFCKDHLKQIQHELDQAPSRLVRCCHFDLHPGNLFYDHQQKIQFIDWEDAGLGDPFFDLARVSFEFLLTPEQNKTLLKHYFSKNVSHEDFNHLEKMRHVALIRMIIYFIEQKQLDANTQENLEKFCLKNNIPTPAISNHRDIVVFLQSYLSSMLASQTLK